jgi:hypothetical protein
MDRIADVFIGPFGKKAENEAKEYIYCPQKQG